MNERKKAVLEMRIGEEDHPKLSKIGRPDSTLLKCYGEAIASIDEIIKNTRYFHTLKSEEERREQLYNYYNNLVIFSAARGCGKTSAMLTFSRFLHNSQNKHERIDDSIKIAAKELEKHSFIVMQPIDPTTLDNQHDIVSLILSRLLHHAAGIWKKEEYGAGGWSNGTQRQTVKAEIVRLLRLCQSAVLSLKNSRVSEGAWSLDYLSDLGSVADLRKHFYELVNKVIELEGCSVENCHLVLQIDDADMNFSYVNNMLESIRNYLMVPNVIILLAADMEMITKVVYQKYMKDYRELGQSQICDADRKLLSQFTEQYILKFFPPKRQINLPDIQEYTQIDKANLFYRQTQEEMPTPIEKGLLEEIFKKTGLVFGEHIDYHYILPTTQRGIGQLLAYLNRMSSIQHLNDLVKDKANRASRLKCGLQIDQHFYYASSNDIKKKGDGTEDFTGYVKQLEAWKKNVQMFRDYFLKEWVGANLSAENQNIISRLNSARLSEKNATVIKLLQNSEHLKNQERVTYNLMMKELTEYQMREDDEQLKFAVQTYYSILAQQIVLARLSEYYSNDEKNKKTTLCTFNSLYHLFGSDFISEINTESTESAHEEGKRNAVMTHWSFTGNMEWLRKCRDDAEGFPKQNELYQNYGASQFLDGYFEAFEEDNSFPMSLYAPIMNCLFFEKVQSVAESMKWISEDQININQENIINRVRYMQDTSLRLVVNCDYHKEIRKIRAIRVEEDPTSLEWKPENRLLIIKDMIIKNFYDAVSGCVFFKDRNIINLDSPKSQIRGSRMKLGFIHWRLDEEGIEALNLNEIENYGKITSLQAASEMKMNIENERVEKVRIVKQ